MMFQQFDYDIHQLKNEGGTLSNIYSYIPYSDVEIVKHQKSGIKCTLGHKQQVCNIKKILYTYSDLGIKVQTRKT